MKKTNTYLVLFLSCVIFLSGCQTEGLGTDHASPDWSRGILIGEGAAGQIGIALDESSDQLYAVWSEVGEEASYLRLVSLQDYAEVTNSELIESTPNGLRQPMVLPGSGETLLLLWQERRQGSDIWQLWLGQVDLASFTLNSKTQLSENADGIEAYTAAADPSGGAALVWQSADESELIYLRLDGAGNALVGPQPLNITGNAANLNFDASGQAHLIWRSAQDFFYAALDKTSGSTSEATFLSHVVVGDSMVLKGPVMAIEDDWAYVAWSFYMWSGLEAGQAHTEYLALNLRSLEVSRTSRLLLNSAEVLDYEAYSGSTDLSQVVSPARVGRGTSYVHEVSAGQGFAGEGLIALAYSQQSRLDELVQVAVVLFDEGELVGFVPAVKSGSFSSNPRLAIDSSGGLHLAWQETFNGELIYFATTNTAGKAQIDPLSGDEITSTAVDASFDVLVSILLFPIFGLGWVLAGFLTLVVVGFVINRLPFARGRQEPHFWSWFILGTALLTFHFTKVITLPTVTTYTPFSAWLQIPEGIELALRVGVPLLIFAIAVLVTRFVRRESSYSAHASYLVIAIVDGLLTMGVYGVVFLGIF